MASLIALVTFERWGGCQAVVQVDLLYRPFMERFALAIPVFTQYNPCDACDGIVATWLEAM